MIEMIGDYKDTWDNLAVGCTYELNDSNDKEELIVLGTYDHPRENYRDLMAYFPKYGLIRDLEVFQTGYNSFYVKWQSRLKLLHSKPYAVPEDSSPMALGKAINTLSLRMASLVGDVSPRQTQTFGRLFVAREKLQEIFTRIMEDNYECNG